MFNKQNNDALLAGIRQGKTLTRNEMLSLIVGLSIPSILAQVTNVLMFYIDGPWWVNWVLRHLLPSDW